jgi:hypothetical protein
MCEPTPSGTAGRCYSATTCTASRTVTRDGDGWVAYLRLEDPGLAPIIPSAAPPPSTTRSWRPTKCGRPGNGGRFRRDLHMSGSDR